METADVRITLALLAYNQSEFVDGAARSALAQACEPIEIIFSDDCSSDDTHDRLQAAARAYSGPHRVVVRRNERNLGIAEHINTVMRLARGRLVVTMAGDDLSLPERVASTAAAWDASGERLDLIASHVIDMDERGQDLGVIRVAQLQDWHDVHDWARERPYVIGAAHAVTRRLFDRFGPLRPDLSYEDQANTLRALCAGGAHTIDAALVRYRRGGLSSASFGPHDYRIFEGRRIARHFAMFAQWAQDAALAGCSSVVDLGMDWQRQQDNFLKQLLDAPTFARQLAVVVAPSSVNAGWRWTRLCLLWLPLVSWLAIRLRDWVLPKVVVRE